MRILVLEDDPDVREALDGELGRAGFAVDVAATITDACLLYTSDAADE